MNAEPMESLLVDDPEIDDILNLPLEPQPVLVDSMKCGSISPGAL